MDKDKIFVSEWVKMGETEEKKEDTENKWIIAFFCYFTAFNYLYNKYRSNEGDRETIKCFLKHVIHNNVSIRNYNPYEIEEVNGNEYKKGVKNVLTGEIHYSCDLDKLKEGDIYMVFLSIYQVRCNLFHGSKFMIEDRNKQLVKDGAIILRDFLNKWLSA